MAELLAPAGSVEALKAAVYNGADAVYLGVGQYNARVKADAFNAANIAEQIAFCHLYGVKVYAAFNTLVKENELSEVKNLVSVCADAGADAFILADLALTAVCAEAAPSVPLHASTQMGVHNLYGAEIAEKAGFSRVILARETQLSDIAEIKAGTGLEIEYFVHGALCTAFSGNCLLSSMTNGNSGNRGRCLQPCRKLYGRNDGRAGYFLSAADQCLVNRLGELEKAGVDSFKIEGRLKRAEYVAETVRAYRTAINGLKPDMNALLAAYNRGGFCEGYNYKGRVISPDIQGHYGVRAGKVTACRRLEKCWEISMSMFDGFEMDERDGYKIVSVSGEEVAGRTAEGLIKRGDKYVIYNNKPYPVGSFVHITSDASRIEELSRYERKLGLKFDLKATVGEPARLTAEYNGVAFTEISEKPLEKAENSPIDEETFKRQLSKLSDTEFFADKIDVETDGCFMPLSGINALRRGAAEGLKRAILSEYEKEKKKNGRKNEFEFRNGFETKKRVYCVIDGSDKLDAYISKNCVIIADIADFNSDCLERIIKTALNYNNFAEILLNLPVFARGRDIAALEDTIKSNKLSGLVVNNIYGFRLCEKLGLKAFGGLGLNLYANASASALGLSEYVASPELNAREIGTLDESAAVYAFGNLRLMTLIHCPFDLERRGCADCGYKSGWVYSDDKGDFPLRRIKTASGCVFELRNGFCHNLSGEIKDGRKVYLDFVGRSDAAGALKAFLSGREYKLTKQTAGHYKRGVL